MIKNYFKSAIRNLAKRKGYAALNIFGLAIGIACCLLIFQYVAYERSYDSVPSKANQIVRLRLDSYRQGKLSWKSATSYPAFGPTMKRDYPEVEDFCRLIDANMLLSNEEKNVKFTETKGYFADAAFINMIDLKLVKGDPKSALDGPDKILLSEETARKYFGNDDPLGKKLVDKEPDYNRILQVTGVFKEFPHNSHLIINHLVSYSTLGSINRSFGDTSNSTETSWGWYDFYTYVQLRKGTDLNKFEAKMPAFCDKYMNNSEWQKANNVKTEIHIIPLRDIHLYSNYNQEAEVNGNGQSVSFLFLIAFFIIAIAWINYINLSTARSLERAREVGVRKVVGALKRNLIIQFMIESFLLNFVALILAIGIVMLLTPSFNQLSGSQVEHIGFKYTKQYWFAFAGLYIVGSFLSGLYPSLVLSGFQPVSVLKGLFKNSQRGLVLRKGLIVGQFAISVVLIAGTMIVYQQVSFMRNQDLGVNIKQTLVLDGAGSLPDSLYKDIFQPFKTSLLQIPGIKNVSASTSVMGKEIYWTNGSSRLGDGQGASTLYNIGIDYDFLPAFGLQLKAGRNFSKDFPTDKKGVLLNEAAADLLGFHDYNKAINEQFRSAGDTVRLLGIVSNYHHQGLQKAIDPMIFRLRPNARNSYSIKIETSNIQSTIASVQKIWSQNFPADPFNFYFLDELYDQQYKADQQFGKVFGIFAFLAIVIASFGLLGLSAYNVLQRTKEIGIRKVMGASIQNVLFILSRDFLKLVLVAFVIAVPVAWWVMHDWLQDFAYRINIKWWVFAIAGVISFLIALFTISFQAFRAAISNPIKALRTE
ncbi:MAG: ABC transporter permease [Bacteroidetes bacterium]|nr:MAG: ABC transporter permease [Bacteroidota bacterium]